MKQKEKLVVVQNNKDTIQPFRVVNQLKVYKSLKNEPEIVYFCKTEKEAVELIKKHKEYR